MNRNHQFILTQDGSPSLLTTYESGVTEAMHHSGGAAAESYYIYGAAVTEGLRHLPDLSVMSLGLGLGYNELITAAMVPTARLKSLTTFEIDPHLKEPFLKWLGGEALPSDWQAGLDAVLSSVETLTARSGEMIRARLLEWRNSSKWKLLGAFPEALNSDNRFNVIFYDAFSRKMDDGLWAESSLKDFLTNFVDQTAVFATYAANGNLKRALKAQGFSTVDRAGFSGKKQSTLAVRSTSLRPASDSS